jgi:hypothetical protein
MGIASGIFGVLAGTVANLSKEYFDLVIVSIGVVMMVSSIFGLLIFRVRNRRSDRG